MPSRLVSIDALRGFAALWVFLYHLWNVYCPECSAQVEPIPITLDTHPAIVATYPVFAYGYAGVGLFFVLSGFCIHLPQARRFRARGADGLNVREFGRRRFWRLYPAFLASLFLASVGLGAMNWVWLNPPGPEGVTANYLVNAFGLSWLLPNAVFTLPITPAAHKLNPVAWTLIYELQFYLLYPLLLRIVRRVGFWRVGVVLLACELLFAYVPTPEPLEPLWPHFEWLFLRRYFDWFLGMWLAERLVAGNPLPAAWGRRMLVIGALGGMLASAWWVTWPLHQLLFAVGSTGLVAWAVANPSPAPNRITRLFAPAGEWSYSLYLIHMPLMRLVFAAEAGLPPEWRGGWSLAAAGAACLLLVPLVAVAWYRLFEKPFLPAPSVAPHRPPNPAAGVLAGAAA
jgi:peptidoglycan/LPS O-acetylase OafA/YrhL